MDELAPAGGTSLAAADLLPAVADEPPIRVMALHALAYCERLFYLEEVEEIRVADGAVYAGRRLHDEVTNLDDETPERRSFDVASEEWGIFGKIDALRRRDGQWVAYEHKRGRCRRGDDKRPEPWPSDRLQAIAYAVLLEEELSEPVPQARIRYHAENVTAFVTIDDDARGELRHAIARARELRRTTSRPPVTENENLCRRCSLAVVCLPEEERLAIEGRCGAGDGEHLEPIENGGDAAGRLKIDTSPGAGERATRPVPSLFPSNREGQTLHVVSPRAHVGRSGERLVVTIEGEKQAVPVQELDAVVIHGFGQMTTQAIQLCARYGIGVQWLTAGGRFIAGTTASPGRVQQRIRQYAALTQEQVRLELARRLVHAKVETQLRYLLRGTRGNGGLRADCQQPTGSGRVCGRPLRRVRPIPCAAWKGWRRRVTSPHSRTCSPLMSMEGCIPPAARSTRRETGSTAC